MFHLYQQENRKGKIKLCKNFQEIFYMKKEAIIKDGALIKNNMRCI